ncbi:MAG: carbohydrate kinase family protein [Pirellula sp.]
MELIEHVFDPGCDALICNHYKAAILTGREAIYDQLEQIHVRCRAKFAFITCEANGIYASDGATRIRVPAYFDIHRKVVDSTRAGDAATAAIVECLLRGLTIEVAALAGVRNSFEACLAYGLTVKNTCEWNAIEDYLQVHSRIT